MVQRANRMDGGEHVPQVDKRYFDNLLRDRQMSLRGLAKLMGLSHSQLSLAFSGHRLLKLEEASQLAGIFNEPLGRIVEAAGIAAPPSGKDRISVVGAVRGDGTVELHQDGVIERTAAPPGLPEDSIAVQFRTAGSPLGWADRWVAFCPAPRPADSSILGRLALVQIKGGPMVLATATRGYRDGSFNLDGFFRRESAELDTASPVFWVRP